MFGRVLGRIENLVEKNRNKENWEGDWLGGGVNNFVVGPECFLPKLTKKFSLQNEEKIEGRKHRF